LEAKEKKEKGDTREKRMEEDFQKKKRIGKRSLVHTSKVRRRVST